MYGMTVSEALALEGGSERMPVGVRVPVVADSGMFMWERKINNTLYRFIAEPAVAGYPARVEVERFAPSRGVWMLMHSWKS